MYMKMNQEFSILRDAPLLQGVLIYEDYSFRFEPSDWRQVGKIEGERGYGYFRLYDLEIHFGIETGRLLYPTGYSPVLDQHRGHLPDISSIQGGIQILAFPKIESDQAIEFGEDIIWNRIYDADKGQVCIFRDDIRFPESEDYYIEFASGVILGLREKMMTSLWLTPLEWIDRDPEIVSRPICTTSLIRYLRRLAFIYKRFQALSTRFFED